MRIVLRLATLDDSEFLLELRNDPETVRHSFVQRKTSRDQHEAWLSRVLADSTERLFIAEVENSPVGRGHLNAFMDGVYVSVSVAAPYRGKGYGREIVSELTGYALDWKPAKPVRAEIRPENIASKKVFAATGFRCVRLDPVVDLWEYRHA